MASSDRNASPKPKAVDNAPLQGNQDLVELDPDHPGFRDAIYRARRNLIAQLAQNYREPAAVPEVEYTDAEQEVWRMVWKGLEPLHDKKAARQYHEAFEQVPLDRKIVPQLHQVNALLKRCSGFQMLPVAGLVSSRTFQGQLSRDVFLATQYMRHSSVPFYTPEPDVVHELVGHAATLAHPQYMRLNRAFGRAALAVDEKELTDLERLYWFTVEFGVVKEQGQLKAYGAGILSSFGELERFEKESKLLPFDIETIKRTPYDPTQYQGTLFVAESFDALERDLCGYLDRVVERASAS
jgi:phenylalanine-4-hydroxylase